MTKRARSPRKGKTKASRARATKSVRAKSTSKGAGKRASKGRTARKPAAHDALDTFVAAAAAALDLPLDPAWTGAVKSNLAVTLALAAAFADFPLPDDAEPAPVFVA